MMARTGRVACILVYFLLVMAAECRSKPPKSVPKSRSSSSLPRSENRLKQLAREKREDKEPAGSPAAARAQLLQARMFLNNFSAIAMEIDLGSPPQRFNSTVAPNAALVSVQCTPNCINCTQAPIFQSPASSSFTKIDCSAPMCKIPDEQVSTNCSAGIATNNGFCKYNSSYSGSGDLSSNFSSPTRSLNITFGCGQDVTQIFGTPAVLGLDRSNRSLLGQLRGEFKQKFTYCISSDTLDGEILLGDYQLLGNRLGYTPMLDYDDYVLTLVSISVDGREFQPSSVSNALVDLNTPVSFLTSPFYAPLEESFRKFSSGLGPIVNSSGAADAGFSTCYNISRNATAFPPAPEVVLKFAGGTELRVDAPEKMWILWDLDNTSYTICMGWEIRRRPERTG